MRRLTNLAWLGLLLAMLWPIYGQTPTSATDFNDRGKAKYAQGDRQGALADFTKAIQLNKSLELDARVANTHLKRADLRDKNGDHEGAVTDYNAALAIDPRNKSAYFGRGLAKDSLKDFKGAMADWRKAIQIDPRYADPYNSLAGCGRLLDERNIAME
jgi:tetratricopeptide (TPR) repeat protein